MISETSPELAELTGHKLRHTWNYEFSSLVDGMDETFRRKRKNKSDRILWDGKRVLERRKFITEGIWLKRLTKLLLPCRTN